MNKVRAKFKVQSITKSLFLKDEEGSTIKLNPVYGDSPENKEFYKWTPGGSIELGTINAKAAESFKLGSEYYVDFTPAENISENQLMLNLTDSGGKCGCRE